MKIAYDLSFGVDNPKMIFFAQKDFTFRLQEAPSVREGRMSNPQELSHIGLRTHR